MTTKEFLESVSGEDFKSFVVDKKEYYKKSNKFLDYEIEDFKKLSYGLVCDFRDKLNEGNILESISFLTNLSYTKVLGSRSKEFIEFFLYVIIELEEITNLENHLSEMKGDYEDKEEACLIQAGVERLNKYGRFGIIDELAGGKLWRHKEIEDMPYEYVLTKLFRDKDKSIVQSNYNGIQRERSK